ncbi:MAG: VOC family protein [Actinobacteria bacterium]|nr:VOC family protein [Actinomycetota bacterium]
MEQRVSLITMGVSDVARARTFYGALGWAGQTVEGTVFFQAGGMAVVLWSRDRLMADAGIVSTDSDVTPSAAFSGITLAHNVRTEEEVDRILAAAAASGATVTRPAARTFYGGYAGYFADPDGHLWEIAHNPGFPLGEDGSITVPDLSTPPLTGT